jgi:pyocin large subunit-like protein
MNLNQRWLYALAVLIVAALFGVNRMGGTQPDAPHRAPPSHSQQQERPQPPPAESTSAPSKASAPSGEVVWSHGQGGAAQNAEHHWRKHGREFPEFHSAAEYEAGALAFIYMPPAGTLIKERSNGDTLYYDPKTNTFAVADRQREPRTFFRPSNGRAYWDRQ